ncbi:MAG: hypothetical protein K2H89_00275 [Oscillospiraceae bacterium]|nr:hypothetical protein [Oscillospiraceae bacterium]
MVNLKKKNRKSTKEYLIATGGKVLVLVSVLANFTEIATWTENFMERHAGKNPTSVASVVELKEAQVTDTIIVQEEAEEVAVAGSAYLANDAIREVTFVESPPIPAIPEVPEIPDIQEIAPPAEYAIPEHVCHQEVAVVEDVDVIECFH